MELVTLATKFVGHSRPVLKILPAALLACALGQVNAAVYAPDSFANGGGTNLETMVMVKDGSNRVVIGGAFTATEGQTGYRGVARFRTDDSLDTTFKVATDDFVKAIAVQPDGKILIGGAFHWVQGAGSSTTTTFWGIARLNDDGTLDTTFQNAPAGQVKSNHNVRGIAVQPDGKIVIGGYFTLIDGVARRGIARLNANGTLDTSFNVGVGTNDGVEDVKLQADGKVLISGSFTSVQGTAIRGVARLNTDGSLDTSFVPNAGNGAVFNGSSGGLFPVYQMAVQNDGKILLNGGPLRFASEYHAGVVRLNTDGTPDSSFRSFINNWGASVALQTVGAEQKIVVGGDFGLVGERDPVTNAVVGTDAQRLRVARFNADGSVDTDFDTSSSANAWVWAVLPNADGTVYLGGKFTSVAGTARRGIARLAPLDPTKQIINFVQPEPATYAAVNGSAVTWTPAPPTTSSAGLPVTYTSVTPAICTVNASTGVVTLVLPATTGICTIQADAAAGQQTVGATVYNVDPAPSVQQSLQIDAPPHQSITFPAQTTPTRAAAGGAFDIGPVATASSGLAVTYSSLTPSVCSVAGTTVTPLSGGNCTIAADQPGGLAGPVLFNAAAQATQSIALQGVQTISFPAQTNASPSVPTGGSFNIAPVATASSGLPVSYTSTTPSVCQVTSGTSVRVLSSGTCTVEANQLGDSFFTAAAPVSQSVTVTATASVTPVPTLGTWALGLLSAAFATLVAWRRRSA